ncbi:hypothetical protein, conserved [Eimeria brunetti]|uniref:Uncharacterized protein n=1 Tax=Eimeria brunetti TaxID=51314 RepID=U6LGR3_9EIME|nr:hypothetical protein, conserved [Eimeria brunetti]
MHGCTAGCSDRLRTPLALSLQRGTTIIRCTHSKYYEDVKRRRAPAPPLPGDSRHGGLWGPGRHPQKWAACKNATSQRHTKACGVTDRVGGKPEADSEPLATLKENTGETPGLPYQPTGETENQYSPGPESEKGNEDGAAAFELPEAPPSPKIMMDWGQTGPCLEAQETSPGDELRPANYLTDDAVVRGYIGIAHALLRHFEEALAARQRLTAGSLECAETVCKALNEIQDPNPRLQLLAQRIATAIGLLHRRKALEDKDAAERGVLYAEVEFPYPRIDTSSWASVPRGDASPLYILRPSDVDGRGVLPLSPGSHPRTQENEMEKRGPPECCTGFPFQTVQCGERQERRIAGPPTPKVVPAQDTTRDLETETKGSHQLAPAHIGECAGENDRRRTSMEDTAIAAPAGKRGDTCLQSNGYLPVSRLKEGMASKPPTGTSSLFLRAEQLRKFSSTEACRLDRPYSTLESTGKPATDSPVLSSSNGRPRGPQSTDGLPGTQLAGPHVGSMSSSATQSHRALFTAFTFRESEGNHVRPLVLSDTHVLADKGSPQWKDDPNRASAAEALALIRCATDLIVSGEGPEFVEKQFFRYFRLDSYQGVDRPLIPEGMAPAKGKYLLLRYAIARVEAEYGDEPAARDTHLYLRDLRRMEEIVVEAAHAQGRTVIEPHGGNEGQEFQRPQSVHSLPERSPEERMERHLPLTILNLPSSATQQDAGQPRRESSPPVHSLVYSEDCNRRSRELECVQPMPLKNEISSRSTSSANPSSPQLNTISLPNPLPSLGGSGQSFEKLATAELSENSTEEVRQPSRASSSSSVPAIIKPGSGLPDVPAAADGSEGEKSSSRSSSRQVSLPTPTLARTPSSSSLAQSTALSGLVAMRRDSSSFDKVFGKSPPSAAGSRSRLLMPNGSFDSVLGEKGFKLSSRSVVRDSVSGEVTSVVFEAPKNTSGQSVLDTATSAALKDITAPRSPSLANPAFDANGESSP